MNSLLDWYNISNLRIYLWAITHSDIRNCQFQINFIKLTTDFLDFTSTFMILPKFLIQIKVFVPSNIKQAFYNSCDSSDPFVEWCDTPF